MTETDINKNYPNISQSFGIAGIFILGTIILSPITMVLEIFMDKELSMFIYYVLAVGISFGVIFMIRKSKTGDTTFNFKIENKRIIPLVIFATIALLFGINTPLSNLIPMPDMMKRVFFDLFGHNGIFSFLMIVIAAPVLEELIFRGIVLDGLLKNYSPVKSILISSLLFGFVHLNPWQFISAFILGCFIGWIYHKTRSLSFAILIHATNNFIGFLISYSSDYSSMDETLVESYGGALNLALAITGSILVLIICTYFLNKEFKKCPLSTFNNHCEEQGTIS